MREGRLLAENSPAGLYCISLQHPSKIAPTFLFLLRAVPKAQHKLSHFTPLKSFSESTKQVLLKAFSSSSARCRRYIYYISYHLYIIIYHHLLPHQAEVEECTSVETPKPKPHIARFNFSKLVRFSKKDEGRRLKNEGQSLKGEGQGEVSTSVGPPGTPKLPPAPPNTDGPGSRSGPPLVPDPRDAREGSHSWEPIFR